VRTTENHSDPFSPSFLLLGSAIVGMAGFGRRRTS
jgi:hypothetical protein